MAKFVSDAVLDAALNHIKNNATQMILCDSQPADRAAAVAGALATVTLAGAGADITVGDDATVGRKGSVAVQNGVTVSTGGNHNHTALISGTDLLFVTTATVQKTLNTNDTVDIPGWDIKIADTPS